MTPEQDEPITPGRGLRGDRLVTVAAAVATIGIGLAFVLYANRGSWFYLDDWDFAILRNDLSTTNAFGAQNQNWHLLTWLLFRILMPIFGFGTYVPFRVASALVLGVIALGVFLYAHRRLGLVIAVAAVVPIIVTPGWEIVLWPFQIGQLFSLAAGVVALVLLDARDGRRSRIGVAVLLVITICSSSAGVPMLIVAIVDRLFTPGRRREVLWAAPALLVYVWWYAVWQSKDPNPNPSNMAAYAQAFRNSIDAALAAVRHVSGLGDMTPSHLIAAQLAFAALVVLICWRLFTAGSQRRARILALSAGLVAYWLLLSWGRANVFQPGDSPRYLYISSVLLVLLGIELATSIRLQQPGPVGGFPRPVLLGLGALLVLGILGGAARNLRPMLDGGQTFRAQAMAMRGQQGAVALMPAEVQQRATFFLAPELRLLGRSVPYYLSGLRLFGDQQPTEAQVKALPRDARSWVDGMLLTAYSTDLAKGADLPPSSGMAPAAAPAPGILVRSSEKQDGHCVRTSADQDTAEATLSDVHHARITNLGRGNLQLLGHRYAPDWATASSLLIAPGTTKVLDLDPDRGTVPWTLGLRGKNALVCTIQ